VPIQRNPSGVLARAETLLAGKPSSISQFRVMNSCSAAVPEQWDRSGEKSIATNANTVFSQRAL